jgi:hypothetical protein
VRGLRGDTSISERVYLDNEYIDTWAPWRDAAIVLRTVVDMAWRIIQGRHDDETVGERPPAPPVVRAVTTTLDSPDPLPPMAADARMTGDQGFQSEAPAL